MIIHQRLQHHNVVKMLSALNYKGRQASVLEFCESGSLEQLLNAHSAGFITETVARKYLTQIHSALEYIHWTGKKHGLLHNCFGHSSRIEDIVVGCIMHCIHVETATHFKFFLFFYYFSNSNYQCAMCK